MTSTTPPPIQCPTSKEKKYDRQLRLWAASGQQALEESHVLLVISDHDKDDAGSCVLGVEALKNLVLPGIGNFTIVDAATVTEADLGVNFFLEEASLGKSRAQECCRLLRELNEDVNGNFISEPISKLIDRPGFLKPYNLVLLAAPLLSSNLNIICEDAQRNSVPIIYSHSVGFYSAFSVQLPSEFPIVDTHPDPTSTQDLRVLNPWPELSAAVAQLNNLETLNDHDHGHVPYILLLLHYLEKWKQSHEVRPPENYKEKTAFRDMVRAGARSDNAEGGEENFDEAVGAVLKSINPVSLNSGVREMFAMDHCTNVMKDSANFWVIARAIKSFHESHDLLPLPGSLPDMKAQTADYIKFQNIYKTKARKDVAEVLDTVRNLEEKLGRKKAVPEQEVEAFCKNAAHVKVIRGSPLPAINLVSEKTAKSIFRNLENPESLIPIFISFLVSDWVLDSKSPPIKPTSDSMSTSDSASLKQPSDCRDDRPSWISELDFSLELLMNKAQLAGPLDEEVQERLQKAAEELSRAGGGELHNISALTGGMVAQEAIKVITGQYVPVDNVCIFDGIGSRSEVIRL